MLQALALASIAVGSVIAIAKENPLLSFLSLFMGMAVATIGIDPLYGVARFSFDIPELTDGIGFIVVGVFLVARS